ncbi:MAG: hypothetical protein AB2L20_07230 [Mangrovibacterium sp.]
MNIKRLANRTKLFGILFLFTTCFLCSSCDKDDDDFHPIQLQYAIFNDKANPVTNNQVTINFPDETKTELIIFGGDGEYSISNSDDTKLGISRIDGYLTLTPIAPGNVVVTISDGRNNSYSLKVEIKSQLRVKMNVKEKEGNIFDLMEFNLFSYSEKDFTLLDLTEAYDSLVWVCTNTNQRYKILEDSGNSTHFMWKWSNCFFLPAEYATCLLGYKNNRVISSDTVVVNITDDRDFLGFNWQDVHGTSKTSTGYHSVFSKGYDFATYSVVTEKVPSLYLLLHRANYDDDSAFAQKSRQVLLDYINSLYGAPTYSSNGDNSVSEAYSTMFKNKPEGTTPEYLWVTSKSRIALVKKYNEGVGYPEYEIYAEPA